MAGEAGEREIEAGGEGVALQVIGREELRHVRMRVVEKLLKRGGIVGRGAQDLLGLLDPSVEAFAKGGDVRGGILGKAVVRKEEALGFARENFREGFIPHREIDIGRRRGGKNVGAVVDADSGGVSDEGDAIELIEVADVMRSMARRVNNFDFARAEFESFASGEDTEILLRDGEHCSEEKFEFFAPEARGAGDEFGRIGHVGRAVLVHVNGEAGLFADERTGSAAVIEMNVREKNGVEIGDIEAVFAKALAKRGERGSGARVDKRVMTVGFEQRGADGVRVIDPVDVKSGDGGHGGR